MTRRLLPSLSRHVQLRALSAGVVVALATVLFMDLAGSTSTSHLVHSQADTGGGDYLGELSLRRVQYDMESRTVGGDVTMAAESRAGGADTTAAMDVWLSLWRTDGAADKLRPCSLTEEWADGMRYAPRLECAGVAFPVREIRTETFYPFDKYVVDLMPRGCIARDLTEGCTQAARNVRFTQLRIDMADPTAVVHVQPSVDGMSVVIERKVFVRGVSVIFGMVAVVFLVWVARLNRPDDLFKGSLGFFGALWALRALIVPPVVKVFPTLVDYCIFTLFCLLFAAVLFAISNQAASQKETP
jgi:hypothetical protein